MELMASRAPLAKWDPMDPKVPRVKWAPLALMDVQVRSVTRDLVDLLDCKENKVCRARKVKWDSQVAF